MKVQVVSIHSQVRDFKYYSVFGLKTIDLSAKTKAPRSTICVSGVFSNVKGLFHIRPRTLETA